MPPLNEIINLRELNAYCKQPASTKNLEYSYCIIYPVEIELDPKELNYKIRPPLGFRIEKIGYQNK